MCKFVSRDQFLLNTTVTTFTVHAIKNKSMPLRGVAWRGWHATSASWREVGQLADAIASLRVLIVFVVYCSPDIQQTTQNYLDNCSIADLNDVAELSTRA